MIIIYDLIAHKYDHILVIIIYDLIGHKYDQILVIIIYGQIGHKYDQSHIWDGIIYHFSHFRKLWTLESDNFNHKMTSSEVKPVQCSPVMVGIHIKKKKYLGLLPPQFN